MLKLFVYGILLSLCTILILVTRDLAFRSLDSAHVRTRNELDYNVMMKLDEFEVLPDLTDVKGVGRVYKELLSASGIDDIYLLVECEADELVESVFDANRWGMYAKRTPAREEILSWQQNAKHLIMTL